MFTGLVEDLGKVNNIKKFKGYWNIQIITNLDDISIGDSISVNGVCLTVVNKVKNIIGFDVIKESLNKSNISHLDVNHFVNLERCLRFSDRLGGHLVQGHVDTQAEVINIDKTDEWTEIDFSIEPKFKKYCIEKGSIAIDGVSLTIASISDVGIKVALIPHTLSNTILSGYQLKQKVNIETDMVGKFIENFSGIIN